MYLILRGNYGFEITTGGRMEGICNAKTLIKKFRIPFDEKRCFFFPFTKNVGQIGFQ